MGKLRHHLEIQEEITPTPTDSFGAPKPKWTTVAKRYAEIEGIEGRELWQGQQVRPDVTHGITIRYYQNSKGEPLGPKQRLKWVKRIFNIESAINIGERKRGTEMHVMVKEER